MMNSLQWHIHGVSFEDGSRLADDYAYDFGGRACRVALVRYRRRVRSPHSGRLMAEGAEEWVRTTEVDEALHEVLKAGRDDPKYGAPCGPKQAA